MNSNMEDENVIGNDISNNDMNKEGLNSDNQSNSIMNSSDMNKDDLNNDNQSNSIMNSSDMYSGDIDNNAMNGSDTDSNTVDNNSVYNDNINGSNTNDSGTYNTNTYNSYLKGEIELDTYRITDMYENDNNKESDKKKHEKKVNFVNKALVFALSAVLFGGLAGGAFLTTTYIGNKYINVANNETTADESIGTGDNSARTVSNQEPAEKAATGIDNSGGVAGVASDVMPSIVSITNTSVAQTRSMFGQGIEEYESESCGSGIIVGQNDTELLIATNNHVVNDANTISATFIDETVVEAKLKGTDVENDLAVIAVKLEDIPADVLSQIKVANLGDSDSLVVGQSVVAIGNALGYGQSVTTGIVSALNREVTIDNNTSSLIQTDAAINPGNSGGALLNMQGEVIGINSSKFAAAQIEGMGYAIPISTAKPIIEQLMTETTREKIAEEERGYLGISGQDVTSEISQAYDMPIGVYIGALQEGSSLADAGIVKGDIITKFEGKTLTSISYLQGLLEYYSVGETVTLTVATHTDGEYTEKTVEVTLVGSSVTTPPETEKNTIQR